METDSVVNPEGIVFVELDGDNYNLKLGHIGDIMTDTQSCNSNTYHVAEMNLDLFNLKSKIASGDYDYVPKLPDDASTMLYTHCDYIKLAYRDVSSMKRIDCRLLPGIFDIKVYGNVVVVDFEDGTTEKAATRGDDEFSVEEGISICLTKKLLSELSNGHGHEAYNKIVNHAKRLYDKKCAREKKEREEAEREAKRIEHKIAKLKEKKEKRLAKKQAAKREEEIEIQKEAYLRAMREFAKEKN